MVTCNLKCKRGPKRKLLLSAITKDKKKKKKKRICTINERLLENMQELQNHNELKSEKLPLLQ